MSGEKRYEADGITVTYDAGLCIHAARCVEGLPEVFDVGRRPWIQPANAAADLVAEVVTRCPTGALRYVRTDGGPPEAPDPEATIRATTDGPLHVRGTVRVLDADGAVVREGARLALCRCGTTKNPPFCDDSHVAAGFRAP